MKRLFLISLIINCQLLIVYSINAQSNLVSGNVVNIVNIFPQDAYFNNNQQAEVHISIDKSNPEYLVVSANTYDQSIYPPYVNQGYYYSQDGGNTWSGDDAFPLLGLHNGDPSTAIGANGEEYMTTMNSEGSIHPEWSNNYVLAVSTNHGASWSTAPTPNVTHTDAFDKEMIAVDDEASSTYVNNFYCVYKDNDAETVNLSCLPFGAASFNSPVVLYEQSGTNPSGLGPNVQTGPNGEVYVCWASYPYPYFGYSPCNGFYFCGSNDGGSTFASPSPYSAVSYSGIDLKGSFQQDINFNNTGINSHPTMAVDKSCGPNNGRIYVAFAAIDGSGNRVIQVTYSDSKGISGSWSAPATVSISPSTSSSSFPWIAVDDVTGVVYIDYFNFPTDGSYNTDTWMAYSTDGTTYNNIKISNTSHVMEPIGGMVFRIGFAGDYNGIDAHNDIAYPTWSDNTNGVWQVYVASVKNVSLQINTATTYTASVNMVTDVEVTPTNTLTIASGVTIGMLTGHHIIVDPGAELIVDGTITNYTTTCVGNGLWGGIVVNGNTSENQTSAYQGTVKLNSGSIIENAIYGITTNSGIITANGATFLDNEGDLYITDYTNPVAGDALKNKCSFTACTFNVDNTYYTNYYSTYGLASRVTMEDEHGVTFQANAFKNTIPITSLSNFTLRGAGIHSLESSFNVTNSCSCMSLYPGGCCGAANTFGGFEYGVYAANANPSNVIRITGNSFDSNFYDIDIQNMDNMVITNNTFSKTVSAGTDPSCSLCLPYNIYLDQCTGYSVSGNSLSNSEYTDSYGILVYNSGTCNNLINNNTFNGIYIQAQAQGTNGGRYLVNDHPYTYTTYSGLQYQCNQFTSSVSSGVDIAVASGLIDGQQGSCTTIYTAANNTFSNSCSTYSRDNIYTYSGYAITYSCASTTPTPPLSPTCVSSGVSLNTCTYSTGSCAATTYTINITSGDLMVADGIDYHSTLRSQKQVFNFKKDSLEGKLARGNTSGLYGVIASGATTTVILDSMLAPGPYLSDSLLKTAILSGLPLETIADILIPNTPLDSSVVSTLNSIGLPDTMATRLNTYQTDALSARSIVVTGINYYQGMMDFTDDALITALETDSTMTDPFDSAQAVLKSDPLTLPNLAQLATLQWAAGENSTALVTLDTLHKHDKDSIYARYCQLLPVLITLSSSSNGYLSLHGNSADSTLLEHIAMDTLTPGYANARAVLSFVYNQSFVEPILPLTGTHKPLKNTNNLYIVGAPTSSLSIINSQFKLYPNPANNSITIQYSLSSSTQAVTLILNDVLGNIAADWSLPGGAANSSSTVNENISSLTPGVYFYTIYEDNKVAQRGKLVIAR